jgi:hypothetical protein
MSTSVDIEFKDFGYFDSDVTGFDDATGLPIFDRAQNSEFLANMLGAIIGNGVYPNPSTNLQVIERDGAVFGVQVLPGKIWIDGRFAWPKEPILLEADPASTTADRIDIVVVERNNPDRKFTVKCITGAPAASPVPPSPERTTDVHQRVLCQYRVRRNATKVNQADILDTRMDNELCGYVTGVVEQIDGETLFAQIEAMIAGEYDHLAEQNALIQQLIQDIQTEDLIGINTPYVEIGGQKVFDAINARALLPDYENKTLYVSVSGNDETGDGTEENPFAHASAAINAIKPNWAGAIEINVGSGNFTETEDIVIDRFNMFSSLTITGQSDTIYYAYWQLLNQPNSETINAMLLAPPETVASKPIITARRCNDIYLAPREIVGSQNASITSQYLVDIGTSSIYLIGAVLRRTSAYAVRGVSAKMQSHGNTIANTCTNGYLGSASSIFICNDTNSATGTKWGKSTGSVIFNSGVQV